MNNLVETLHQLGITASDDALYTLKTKKSWIRLSKRVETMLKKITMDELYETFNFEHHKDAAGRLLSQFLFDNVAVVYGHKAQGKSQFLFFMFRLLQELGETVVYLDSSILPDDELCDIGMEVVDTWKENLLLKFSDSHEVSIALKNLIKQPSKHSFGQFLGNLKKFSSSGNRVWVIVDEVVQFSNFPITLPEEQKKSPFNWIVTGSAGIGTWVAKRHLRKYVFDLPLWSKYQCVEFLCKICKYLNIDISKGIGDIPYDALGDWLDEKFGGVIGYICELLFAISEGKKISDYIMDLNSRVDHIIRYTAKNDHISVKQLSEDWLNAIKSPDNT